MKLFTKALKGYFLFLAFCLIAILGFVAFIQILVTPIPG